MNNINQQIKDLEATLVSLKAKAEAQESTLTPVSFESKGELARALVDGRTFKIPDGSTIMYGEETSFSSPFRIMRDGKDVGAMKHVWDLYADLQEINAEPAEPWYLNIPEEGVECYVSDYHPDPYPSTTKVLVTGYDQSLSFPFKCLGNWWKYARPAN
jgi:hypothetical protein